MEKEGKIVICNRCGKQEFLAFTGEESRDGGFSPSIRRYEDLPDSWLYATQMGHLCPGCADIFRTFVTNFMNGKVAPVWYATVEKEG